jgi:site-specific DNA-methyltransferase (cytosine-N4-specific)
MNPLAILISNAKVQALNVPSAVLEREAAAVTKELERRVGNVSFTSQWDDSTAVQVAGSNWRHALVNETYLSTWFPAPVLAQLVAILRTIERHEAIGDILRVVLSDLVRRVSYQDPGDLRIRRRKDAEANYPAIPLFVASLNKKLSMVVRAQQVAAVSGRQIAVGGDSREPLQAQLAAEIDSDLTFDAGVTSPPYATALPYIDTQRLSLALLGLIGSADIAALDERLIGTREVKKLRRVQFEDSIATDETIASEVRDLCLSMLQSVKSSSSDGFRRHNTPALVYQYFRDMGKVLDNVREVIKPNGAFVMIVGRNRSTLGGNDYVVDTPRLLQETALVRGWYRAGSLELDTYPRYDLHQRNSIRTETMLILRRQE